MIDSADHPTCQLSELWPTVDVRCCGRERGVERRDWGASSSQGCLSSLLVDEDMCLREMQVEAVLIGAVEIL